MPMATLKLYHEDAYRTSFTARVLSCTQNGPAWDVELDQTCFYPTAGGQPNDLGHLGGQQVLDVREEDDGRIIHAVAAPLTGEVAGEIVWERRLDHMEQHTGQHLLSGTFERLFDAETLSWHLGEERCTVDIEIDSLSPEQALQVEDACNTVIRKGLPIVTYIVDQERIPSIPLRKPPKVTENIRIVEIEGYDWSACAGTHVRNLGELNLLKVKSWEKHKKGVRVDFVVGGRARRDYQRLDTMTLSLSRSLSIAVDDLPRYIERSQEEVSSLRKLMKSFQEKVLEYEASELVSGHSQRIGNLRVVRNTFAGRPIEEVRLLAAKIAAHPGTVALFGTRGAIPQLVMHRSVDLRLDMGAIMRHVLPLIDGKGGGSPLQAQGGGSRPEQLEHALDEAMAKLAEAFHG